ncbi:hypothetical protein E2320_005775, partial [Naja naja]
MPRDMRTGEAIGIYAFGFRTLELAMLQNRLFKRQPAGWMPKLLSKELLDLVASHFNLKEKEYFGIAFTDETFYIESISYLKDNATIELFFLNAKS